MPRRSQTTRRPETGAGRRYPVPWHNHVEIAPGNWSVIGDMSLTVGAPLEGCAAAHCPGSPKSNPWPAQDA